MSALCKYCSSKDDKGFEREKIMLKTLFLVLVCYRARHAIVVTI
jgi:hypothetical protein